MKFLRHIAILAAASALAACGYDDFGSYRPTEEEATPANALIGDLHRLYGGNSYMIYDDLTLAGYVSANDAGGNFFRTFVIEDSSGAIEVRAGLYDLHSVFPRGRYVAVKAKGLCLGMYDGVLQIGLPVSDGGYQADYFGYMGVLNRYVQSGGDYKEPQAARRGIDELDEHMCGMLVEIAGVAPEPDQDGNLPETWAVMDDEQQMHDGYRIFADGAGRQIAVHTSRYADFAAARIPTGRVTLRGILTYGKPYSGTTMFMIKLRDTNDVIR